MECAGPLVSVVIPTRDRPHLVVRAVHSALAQTLDANEVIVVTDGADEATLQALRQIDDARLKVRTLSPRSGVGDVMNAGVNEARGRWIALLDDDDEWLPGKLELQLHTAKQSRHLYPIISCRLIARSGAWDHIWPRRLPEPNESLSEYLFCRTTPFWGEGLVQSSTLFASKELFRRVAFRSGLRRHLDIDWLLRASAVEGAGVEFVPQPQPLVIWHIEENRSRVSTASDWRYSLSWIRENRHLLTPRAYASFLMTMTSGGAARKRDWKAFLPLLLEACRHGRPSAVDALLYLGIWLIPRRVRSWGAMVFEKRHRLWVLRRPEATPLSG